MAGLRGWIGTRNSETCLYWLAMPDLYQLGLDGRRTSIPMSMSRLPIRHQLGWPGTNRAVVSSHGHNKPRDESRSG